jgi:hypothetical protein
MVDYEFVKVSKESLSSRLLDTFFSILCYESDHDNIPGSYIGFQLWLDYPTAWRLDTLPFYNKFIRLGVVPAIFLGWLFMAASYLRHGGLPFF